mgnify:CR=1 FL=1
MSDTVPRGPLGDARPDTPHADTRGDGPQPPEKVEDRENVGTVRPEDYPGNARGAGDVTGASNRGRRRSQASGAVSGSGAGAGGGGNPEDFDSDAQGGCGGKMLRTDRGPKVGADAPQGGSR